MTNTFIPFSEELRADIELAIRADREIMRRVLRHLSHPWERPDPPALPHIDLFPGWTRVVGGGRRWLVERLLGLADRVSPDAPLHHLTDDEFLDL